MKRFLSLCLVLGLCIRLSGCSNDKESNSDNASVKLSDYPSIKEKADKVIKELESSPSIEDVKTNINYKEASSNTKNIIALHYSITNDGEVTLQFDIDGAKLNSATVKMAKENVDKSQDFIAMVSAFSSIEDFDVSSEEYQQIGEIAKNMKTTKVGDLTVSMKDFDGIWEFSIIKN